jgi:hypothetical protein
VAGGAYVCGILVGMEVESGVSVEGQGREPGVRGLESEIESRKQRQRGREVELSNCELERGILDKKTAETVKTTPVKPTTSPFPISALSPGLYGETIPCNSTARLTNILSQFRIANRVPPPVKCLPSKSCNLEWDVKMLTGMNADLAVWCSRSIRGICPS